MEKTHQTTPRDHWTRHPNYPHNALLLGSHANFRSISERLVIEARSGDRASWVGHVYRRWIGAMRSHEAYEEQKLYPYLALRWGVSFADCERGHLALHARDAEVRAVLREADAHYDAAADAPELAERLTAALQAHDAALVAHLEVEEDAVIPLLLNLSRAEFTRYTLSSLSELLRDLGVASPTGSNG